MVREKQLTFDPAGGNSSLTKIQFQTEKEVVTYQLAMGMEKLKNRRLPASLLLEGLIALAMFGVLTTLVLGELGDSTAALRRDETRRSLASRKNGDPDKAGSIEHQSGQCPGGEVCQVFKGLP